jgi:hypothetical protein
MAQIEEVAHGRALQFTRGLPAFFRIDPAQYTPSTMVFSMAPKGRTSPTPSQG